MKKLMRRIDRYCILHPDFGISNLILYIIIGQLAVWLMTLVDNGVLEQYLLFSASAIFTKGQVWRLITFVLVPDINSFWLLFELYFYYFIGSTLERHWGKGKFTVYYLMGVLLTIIYGSLVWLFGGGDYSLTASYINLSMFLAFATLFPDTVVLLMFIIPVKMKWLGYIAGGLFVGSIIFMLAKGYGFLSLMPVIALLNYLLFCGDWLFDYFRPARTNQRRNTINYRKAAKKYNKEQSKKPYTRKCEVCGRTDADYPDLEFRFCSQCVGYHCFCIDHINNHVHFKE